VSGGNVSARPATVAAIAPLEQRSVKLRLKDLKILEGHENARYMKAPQFQRLVDNLKRDGILTSAPLVYRGVVRSGNHRVQAAIKAGIEQADCLELLGEIPEERVIAIQLAHNAINGEDDPAILGKLWKALPFEEKRYSGLTDEMIGAIKEIDIASLGMGGPEHEEIVLLFLPEEAGAFHAMVKRIEKKSRKPPVFAAARADFEKFFDAIVATKGHLNVHNTALAISMMAQLALERIDQLVAESSDGVEVGSDGSAGA
jgi:hypothetical protein